MAQEIYAFLRSVHNTFPDTPSYLDEFSSVLHAPQTNSTNVLGEILEQLEPTMRMSTSREKMWPHLCEMLSHAQYEPQYADLLFRVAESFPLIHRVEQVLSAERIPAFIDSLLLHDPTAQHEQVMMSIQRYLDTLDSDTRKKINQAMYEQRQTSNEDFLGQIHYILNDQALFEQFEQIFFTDHLTWADRLVLIYQLIQTHKPEVWDRVSLALDQVESSQDTQTYNSYEEYVQKNFLDNGGQKYLDDEAEQAHVEHLMGSMNV
ncbi:hypothetical protein BX666DRAFT_2022431 [Dichotomocladium elegans]|nr:hypothetical protein BX666DRAFT_2022431 [Dichotomocladium elegans]